MNYAFVSGIPAAGKSYLAVKVAMTTGILHIEIDEWREEMKSDPELRRWVDFFWNQDEAEYWRTTNCEQHWENLKIQSEAFWPTILKRIKDIRDSGKPAIFEGVNILPHLARKDLNFNGIFLLGESFEFILERNKKDPRWGKSEELQIKEAEAFWNCERLKYRQEAERHGFKTFSDISAAENELLRLIH